MDFRLDEAKCIGCGACAEDCPMRVFEMREGKPFLKKPENCFHCQHCLAVCPTGAITLDGVSPADCLELNGLALPSAEQMDHLMLARRSIRNYKQENVPRGEIRKMLELLSNAPTGCNNRDLTFRVVETKEKMREKLEQMCAMLAEHRSRLIPFVEGCLTNFEKSGYDGFFRSAPHLLIVEGRPDAVTPQIDCDAALAYFSMIAQAHGLGTTWCGFLPIITSLVPEVRDLFQIPRNAPYYAMLFGYPKVRYARTVNHSTDARIVWL